MTSTRGMLDALCDVPHIRIGHAQDSQAKTGCTVIIPEYGAVASAEIRGHAPGSRELALLDPIKSVQKIHAVLLTGGSAFGLDAAAGVMQFLESKGIGYDTGIAKIPLVPAAVIFDLATGRADIRPDKKMGLQAAQNAVENDQSQGKIGAGTGATIGKILGMDTAGSGGIGQASRKIGDKVIVAALSVVNALGDIVDPATGKIIAGARRKDGGFLNSEKFISEHPDDIKAMWGNTTLSVVATNAKLTKLQAQLIAQSAHDGLARAIRPVHTRFDGDTVFVLSCGDAEISDFVLSATVPRVVVRSILKAVAK